MENEFGMIGTLVGATIIIVGFILVVFLQEREKEKLDKIKLDELCQKEAAEELYKSVEKSIEVLKKMPSESSSRLDKINKYLKDNIESMKKEGMAEGDNHGAIFNPELKMKLKMIVQQQFFFPGIISAEIKMLSGLVNDGIALLKASIGEHANIENVSKTKESSVEKPVLLIAPPERYNEIIDVEVID